MKGIPDVHKDTKRCPKNPAGPDQQRRMGKWINLSIALLLLFLPATALAQDFGTTQISAKVLMPRDVNSGRDVQNSVSKAPNYRIGPQDVLDITVWKEPEVSRTVPVRPDGNISLPLLNDLTAEGLTPTELAAQITERLKRYFSDPKVTVIVTSINSQRIYILGEVTHAGAYPLLPRMTVLQALSFAGGFTQFANVKNISLLREEDGKQVKYPFNCKEVVNGKNRQQNAMLKAGDTIIVP